MKDLASISHWTLVSILSSEAVAFVFHSGPSEAPTGKIDMPTKIRVKFPLKRPDSNASNLKLFVK